MCINFYDDSGDFKGPPNSVPPQEARELFADGKRASSKALAPYILYWLVFIADINERYISETWKAFHTLAAELVYITDGYYCYHEANLIRAGDVYELDHSYFIV